MKIEEINQYVGAKIKEYRKSYGLKQEELAKKIGVGKTTISNYEVGLRSPKKPQMIKLSEVFGVSIDDFFPKAGKDNRNSTSIIDETVETMKQLDEAHQKVVLATANVQLKEQKESETKVIPMKKKSKVLTEEALQEAVDTAVAFDGIPLNEQEKEAAKALIRRFWEEDHLED